jgi:biogenesis of lysosome-related organelles complex 1 subunit 2
MSTSDDKHETSSIANSTATTSTNTEQNHEMIVLESNKIFQHLIKEMLESSGDYVKSEIDLCINDYQTLEKMNRTVTEKYKDLCKHTSIINTEMHKLNDLYTYLIPLLSQINDVEKCVTELEKSASKLENYSKKLETKFKQFSDKYLANK